VSEDNVTVTIDGKEYAYWADLEITQSIDNHATVGFNAPFEPERKAFRDTFRPFTFKPLHVDVDGERLFTGTLVDVNPKAVPTNRTVAISAYSKAAVLADCTIPPSLLPFETNGLSLRQIAQRLISPFGLDVVVTAPEGTPFKRVNTKSRKVDGKAEADQKVQDFLAELAKQRVLILSSTKLGDLLMQESVATGNPVAVLEEGTAPLIEVTAAFNPQSYYSEITGYTSHKRGQTGAKYTERNQRLAGGVLRPYGFKLDDVEKADAPAAVRAKLGRMYGGFCSYVLQVPTWRDPNGKLWEPNTTIVVKYPSAMIYNRYEFLIRDVVLKRSADEETASIGLVLPGAFSGEAPATLPWED
jgi:prophage tail gpP-like protein